MKKSFFVFSFLLCSVWAFAQLKIERSYCGLSLGKTTNSEIIKLIECSDANKIPNYLCGSEKSLSFTGKFTVDGFNFSILVASFYNDTLYELEFVETCQYCDISDKIRSFMQQERIKYSMLRERFESMADTSFYVMYDLPIPINKTDGSTNITTSGNASFISLTLDDKEIQERALAADLKILNRRLSADYSDKNMVTGVGGLTFGETKEMSIRKFSSRGTLIQSENRKASYSDVSVGGLVFDYGILYFSSENQDDQKKLIAVTLQKLYMPYQFDLALQMYQSVCQTYQTKYANGKELQNQGNTRMSGYGMLSDDYAEGKSYPIGITLQKSISRGGSQFYYVTVSYFIDNISSINNDDI